MSARTPSADSDDGWSSWKWPACGSSRLLEFERALHRNAEPNHGGGSCKSVGGGINDLRLLRDCTRGRVSSARGRRRQTRASVSGTANARQSQGRPWCVRSLCRRKSSTATAATSTPLCAARRACDRAFCLRTPPRQLRRWRGCPCPPRVLRELCHR